MTSKEQIEKEYQDKLCKLHREERLLKNLPTDLKPRWVYDHKDHMGIKYEKEKYGEAYTMQEAFTLINQWKDFIIISEHWKDSCVSCRPSVLQKKDKIKNAVLDGQSFVELQQSKGKGYGTDKFTFWAKLPNVGLIIDVDIVIQLPWKYKPSIHDVKWHQGDFISQRVDPPSLGADSRRKWWNAGYGYHISWYWADEYNFDSWASHYLATELKEINA